MKDFFQPNIDRNGRVIRGLIGALCLIGGVIICNQIKWWIGLILVSIGLFVIFEAVSQWCVLRACKIKTKF